MLHFKFVADFIFNLKILMLLHSKVLSVVSRQKFLLLFVREILSLIA